MLFGRKKREAAAAAAQEYRVQVEAAGWRWRDAAPPPSIEICEAALRSHRGRGLNAGTFQPVWPIGMAEVVDGAVDGRPFTAAKLAGYARGNTRSGTVYGDLTDAHLVWTALPGSVPELRLVDTFAAAPDHGVRLPPMASPPWMSARWSVEGFVPQFAAELLTPEFVTALEALPADTTVVFRAGVIIAYGWSTSDVVALRTRVAALGALLDAVAPQCWGRADALLAGTGVFPYALRDGAALRLDQRLVSRDWKGLGVGTSPWQETPDLPRTVYPKMTERGDTWDVPPGIRPGLTIGFGTGGAVANAARHGIPTVAETLRAGSPDASAPRG